MGMIGISNLIKSAVITMKEDIATMKRILGTTGVKDPGDLETIYERRYGRSLYQKACNISFWFAYSIE